MTTQVNSTVLGTLGNLSVTGNISANSYVGGSVNVTGNIADGKGDVRAIPQNSQSTAYTLTSTDAGKHISISSGNITVPPGVFTIGDVVTIFNANTTSRTVNANANITCYLAGTTNTGNRTIGSRGLVTVLCVAANIFVISGAGLS
jgi:hypothetical protein